MRVRVRVGVTSSIAPPAAASPWLLLLRPFQLSITMPTMVAARVSKLVSRLRG